MTAQYTQPTSEERQEILRITGESERLVKDVERQNRTTISRSETWKREQKGTHPKRIILGSNSIAWLLSDILLFIYRQVPENTTEMKSK